MKIKYLITGATGFIGKNYLLESRLLNSKNTILFKRDGLFINSIKVGRSISEASDYFSDLDELFVLHLATKYVKNDEQFDVSELIDSNVIFGSSILSDLKKLHLRKISFLNFCSAFQSVNYSDYEPTIYTKTKNIFKDILELYNLPNLTYKNIYLYDTFGKNDQRKKLLPYILKCAQENKICELKNSEQFLVLTNISSIVRGIDFILENLNELNSDLCLHQNELISLKDITFIAQKYLEVSFSFGDSREFVKFNLGELPKNFIIEETLQQSLNTYFKYHAQNIR